MADDFVERKLGNLTVRIDRGTCISSANCLVVAPEVLEFDDDTIVNFIEEPEEFEEASLIEACKMCPVEALYVFDKDGKILWFDIEFSQSTRRELGNALLYFLKQAEN